MGNFFAQSVPKFIFFVLAMVVLAVLVVILSQSSTARILDRDHPPNKDPEGFVLEHVVMISRHGLRAPSHLSNWSNPDDYPMGVGYLTAKGKQQSLSFGESLRSFYGSFLSDNPREVWARSSTYPRCFETLSLILASLYAPKGKWDFGFKSQPIPITMVPDGNDVNIESCTAGVPKDFKFMYRERNSFVESDGFESVGDFFNWLTDVSGFPRDSSSFYEPIVDALYCQKFNGLKIPIWASDKAASMDWAMRRLSYEYWIEFIPYYGQYMGKMVATRLAKFVSAETKQRLSIFLYHDTTLQALLSAFKVNTESHYPSFLGTLHFQLYRKIDTGVFYVRTLFQQGILMSGEIREAVELKIPQCSFPNCSLLDFEILMNNIYPNTERDNCQKVDLRALL